MPHKISKDKAVSLLTDLCGKAEELIPLNYENPLVEKWESDIKIYVHNIFGGTHDSDCQSKFSIGISHLVNCRIDSQRGAIHVDNVNRLKIFLISLIEEINNFWGDEGCTESSSEACFQLKGMFDKFHAIVRQLRNRHEGRVTLDVEDEYDVQDLVHSLLWLCADDVRPEEWTPSYAGSSSRMDFLLPEYETAIEIKMTRRGLKNKEAAEQLIIDKEHYKAHPQVKQLICFVYDPEMRIDNPRGFEKDLSQDEPLKTVVYVRS